MKYIYYIATIFMLSSFVLGYALFQEKINIKIPQEHNIALIINDKYISIDEFNKLVNSRSKFFHDKEEAIDSIIDKEIILQEAEIEGINKEESFRLLIKDYYEQSLTKILIERKISSLNINVYDEEINNFQNMLNKKIYITQISSDLKSSAQEIEKKIINFIDLSDDIKNVIYNLKENDQTEPITINGKKISYKIDKIETDTSIQATNLSRDDIHEILKTQKQKKNLDEWISNIKSKSAIKILIDTNN